MRSPLIIILVGSKFKVVKALSQYVWLLLGGMGSSGRKQLACLLHQHPAGLYTLTYGQHTFAYDKISSGLGIFKWVDFVIKCRT
jgi:hypothetical protein